MALAGLKLAGADSAPGGMMAKLASKIKNQTQHYVLASSDSLIEDLNKEMAVWRSQLEKDQKFRVESENENQQIMKDNDKLRYRVEQQRQIVESKRRDPYKVAKITTTLDQIKQTRSQIEQTVEAQRNVREELLVIKASLVIQERIHHDLSERMQKHIDDLEEKVSLEQKIVQCKESIERLKLQYEKLLKLQAKLGQGTTEQIRITETLIRVSALLFQMHQYERRTSQLDNDFLHTGIELYKVLDESRKLISRNNLVSDKLPYTLSPLKDDYLLSVMDRWASMDLQVDDEDQVKFSKMSVAYIFRIFIVEVKIKDLIGFLEKQCNDYDQFQILLRKQQADMLAIDYDDIKDSQIEQAQLVNDQIDEKMKYFNNLTAQYSIIVNTQRTGVDRFQEKIRVQCGKMGSERYRLDDILSKDGLKRVYTCVDTLKDFYYDVERVLKLKWLSHRYDYFINFRRQVMEVSSQNNDLAANFHILRMTLDKIRNAMRDIENQDINRIDKIIRKLDTFMESALKDHENLCDIEKKIADLQIQNDELKKIVCDEAEKQVRETLKSRDAEAKKLKLRDEELLKYFTAKKTEYESLKGEIDQEDIELYNRFLTYEGQIHEVEGDEETAKDQAIQIQQRVDRLAKQFDNLGPVQMKDIDEVSDIIDLLTTISFHVQTTENLIEEAFKKIKDFEIAIKEILKYIRSRRQANCDKSLQMTYANLDRMIKLIDRYNNDIKNITEDQNKLINNGHIDLEKDRDTTQFQDVISSRQAQMKTYGQKRDEFKISLDTYQKTFEEKKKGDQNSSGVEFQKIQRDNDQLQGLIQKEIQNLEGSTADDIQAAKEENLELLRKYLYKVEKHEQSVVLRDQKQKDFIGWLQTLADMKARHRKLEGALDGIKYNPEHQNAFNHFNHRLQHNQGNVNEADRLIQTNTQIIKVEAADLENLPSSIVKTSKIEYIYEMLLKMKFLTDTFNEDIGTLNDELKQLEKEIYDYLNKLKASNYQDCQDLLDRLDASLEKLNKKIAEVDGDKQEFEKEFDAVKNKLKNREQIQTAYNGLSNEHDDVKQKRDKFRSQIQLLKDRFALIDKDNVDVQACQDILSEGNQLDNQINEEFDKDVEIQEKLRRLLMKLKNMNANQEERDRLINKIKGLLADNKELLRLMKQHIDNSNEKNHEFEKLYASMIASQDYANRKPNNQKKIPKLMKMRDENERYKKLRSDGVAVCDKYTDDYLEETYDTDELNDVVNLLTKLNGDLKTYVKALDAFVKAMERRRLKVQDAEVRKNANKHMKTHDEVEGLQIKCISALQQIDAALKASAPKNKADQDKRDSILVKLSEYQVKLDDFKPKFEKVSKDLKELVAEIKPKDLEKQENVVKLAEYIDRLANIGAILKELKDFISALWAELDELLASLSSMDLERKIRDMIEALKAAIAQNEEIADHIKRIIKLTDSYDGYTSGAEDKTFFTGMNGKSKKLLDELKASSAAMQKTIGDLEKFISIIRTDKKTGDPSKDQAQTDKRKGEIGVFEQAVNKHLDGQKNILESSLTNKATMSDHTLEDKIIRRNGELEEIDAGNLDNLAQIQATKDLVEEEINNLSADKAMAAHCEKLRVALAEGEKFLPLIEEFQKRTAELTGECNELSERTEAANEDPSTRTERRLDLYDAHLILKKKIRDFKKEMQALWDQIQEWINMLTQLMGKKPEKVMKPAFKVVPGDDIDKMLSEMLMRLNCSVPITRIGNGYYMFGSKKIFCKIINGKLVVRVGGGYMGIEEFILTYMKNETDKAGLASKIEEQIKAKGNSNFSAAAVSNTNKKIVKK